MGSGVTIEYIIAALMVIFLAIGLHEYAHAKVADMAGDPTPRLQGRVTLNLIKHFDPIGTMMIVFTTLSGFGIGWGKPVMVNPSKMKNPKWDHVASVAAGPLSNLLQAMVFAVVFRLVVAATPAMDPSGFLYLFLFLGVKINIALMLFNLIPFGPLDGHWLLGYMLPEPARTRWFQFNRVQGGMILLAVILLGQFSGFSVIGLLIRQPADFLTKLLLGM